MKTIELTDEERNKLIVLCSHDIDKWKCWRRNHQDWESDLDERNIRLSKSILEKL